jgi:hypothetical protein
MAARWRGNVGAGGLSLANSASAFVNADEARAAAVLYTPRSACARSVAEKNSFMHYDLGYFDDETCRLEPVANPFGPKVLPMSPE